MPRSATRLNSLFSRKRSEASRKNPRRRSKLRNRIAGNWAHVESLESRAMLASDINISFVEDWSSRSITLPAPGGTSSYTYSNSFGTLLIELAGSDDVYIHRQGDNWSFYSDSKLNEGDLIDISDINAFDVPFDFTSISGAYDSPRRQDVSVTNTAGVYSTSTGNVSMPFTNIVIRAVAGADAPGVFFVGGSGDFNKQIYIDLRDPDSGEMIAGSSVYVGSPIVTPASTATYGNRSPATGLASDKVSNGGLYIAASKIDINANVTVAGNAVLRTGLPTIDTDYGVGSDDHGIFIRRSLTVNGGNVSLVANGADVRVLGGGSITDTGGASLATLVGDLTDADLYVTGTLAAAGMQLLVRGSEMGTDAQTRFVTTRAADTGIQTGTLSGTSLIMSLNNQLDGAIGADGEVDIKTNFSSIRIATGLESVALDYDITIQNSAAVTLDSVMSSEGDIDISTDTGTITLLAAIDTAGGFALGATGAGAGLTISSAISSGKNVSLTATGALVTNAAILANQGGTDTGLVTLDGGTVTVNSLVEGASGVEITADTTISQGVSATSLVRAGLVTLDAGTSINLNTEASELVANAGTAIAIRDRRAAQVFRDLVADYDGATQTFTLTSGGAVIAGQVVKFAPGGDRPDGFAADTEYFVGDVAGDSFALYDINPADPAAVLQGGAVNLAGADLRTVDVRELLLTEISAGTGSISITADQSIKAVSTIGGAAASLTSSRGDIVLGAIALPAGQVLTLSAAGYEDEDDLDGDLNTTEILGGSIGLLVEDELPAVTSIDWTAYNVPVQDFYSDIPTIAATLLGSGDLEIDSDGSVTVTRAVTTDGKVSVKAAGTITIAGVGITTALDNELGDGNETADITLESTGSGVVVGALTVGAAGAQVTVTAAQGITATGLIRANTISLEAGALADIGSSGARVNVAGFTALDTTMVTVNDGAGSVFLGNSTALQLVASAQDVVNVLGTGSLSSITVDQIEVASESGKVTINSASADVTVNSVVVAEGAFDDTSSITLSAGRYLVNGSDPIDLQAYALSLTASTLTAAGAGHFKVTALDAVTRVSATATGLAGQINLHFERDADLEIGAFSAAGDIIVNLDEQTAAGAVPTLIIGAGNLAAGATSKLSLESDGAIRSTDDGSTPGILSGKTVSLTAHGGEIDVRTQASLLEASGSSDVTISQTGNVQIGSGNLVAADTLSLTVLGNGSISAGPGVVRADSATLAVAGTGSITVNTDVDTLVASSVNRPITVVETNALSLGAGGVNAGTGDVKITLTAGNLAGVGEVITGGGVTVKLLAAGALDADIQASSLSASTANGAITLRNTGAFSIGADGIVAGDGAAGFKNVTLESTAGLTGGTGKIKANVLAVEAAGAVTLATTVSSVDITTSAGAVALTQSDAILTIDSIVTTAGGVTVTSNRKIEVESISAGGSGSVVALTTTGAGQDIVLENDLAVVTAGAVTLTASGAINGTRDVYNDPGDADPVADISGGNVVLQANGGAIDATVKATGRLTAKTLGAGNDVLLTLIGTRPVIVGTAATHTSLSATGSIEFSAVNTTVLDENENPTGNDIVVLVQPTIGAAETITYDTLGQVVHAVTNSSAQAVSGSLATAVASVADSPNANALGSTSVAFATTVSSAIQPTATLGFGTPIVIDGTRRINTTTGSFQLGRQVDFDGAKLSGANLFGVSFNAGADNSIIRGLAFTNFNRTGGGAVRVDGADGVEIRSSAFGITSTGRVVKNAMGISVASAAGTVIDSNTIVMSTGAGVLVGADADGTEITNNYLGTDRTRRNYGNAVGIDVTGAGTDGIEIDGNLVACNTTAGIRVASDATNVDISDNEVVLNGVGVQVGGTAGTGGTVTLTGNTVARNTGSGVRVTGAATNVLIGGAALAERNFIGTNAAGSAGLGNSLDGIRIDSTGSGIDVINNIIANNGTANRTNENNGINIAAATPNVDVVSNVIRGNRGNGLRVAGGTATAQKNSVFSNMGSGVLTSGAATVTVGGAASADNTEANGNVIYGNSRYGLELGAGVTAAALSGNSLTGNRMGGVFGAGALAAPVITNVTVDTATGTLSVTFSAAVAAGTQVHLYLGNGTGTSSQGGTYVGRVGGAGSATITLKLDNSENATKDLNLAIASLVRVGAPITATFTTGGVVSRFASNFIARKA